MGHKMTKHRKITEYTVTVTFLFSITCATLQPLMLGSFIDLITLQ
jgi:hypothetical protein